MPRILTVDDSRAIRSIVSKQVIELGFEVDEAEHGEDGLAKLEECYYDLVVLDVTMPVMDGPTMLKRMREKGNQTPVLMLTSESKRGTVAEVMKAGIDDYVLKPFKPEELAGKIRKALRLGDGPVNVVPDVAPAKPAERPAAPEAPPVKQFVDVLIVDDMENVHRKLRGMLPQHLSAQGCVSAQSALTLCRERVARVVLIDWDIPDVNSAALLSQLKLLQPHAAFLAMPLRTVANAERQAKIDGFDGVLFKPFDATAVEDFLLQYFDNQDLVTIEEDLVKINQYTGNDERVDRYFQRLGSLIPPALQKLAAACFEAAIIDITKMPLRPDLVPKLVASLDDQSKKMGIELRLVGSTDSATLLKGFTETVQIPFYADINEARAA